MTVSARRTAAGLGTTGLTLAMAVTGGVASGAPGKHSPSISAVRDGRHVNASFKFGKKRIAAGAKPVVHYDVKHAPKSSDVLLQRTHGHRFETVKHLKRGKHSYKAPAVGQGKYTYRLIVVNKHGVTLADASNPLFSYSGVSLAAFLGDSTDTVNINGQEFRYVEQRQNNDGEIVKVNSSSCRAIAMQVGADNNYYNDDTTPATISVVQENADEKSFGVPAETVQSAVIGLARGAWEIDTAGDGDFNVYLNAGLSCYTPTGSPDFGY